jgi:polar amino acid transport system substrate-binding protein
MAADSPIVGYAVKQTGGKLELIGEVYDTAPYGFIFKKDNGQFKEAVQGALKALITDGTYKQILEKYGVESGAITEPAINAAQS